MLGVRLDEQLESRLNALADKMQRSKSFLAKEALIRYIEEEECKQRENELTMARWEEYQETGETVSNYAMTDWLGSWGTDQEKPCPVKECGYRVRPEMLTVYAALSNLKIPVPRSVPLNVSLKV